MQRYTCGYCGKSYERIEERMRCESICSRNNSEKKRLEELSIARRHLTELRTKESALVAKLQTTKDEIRKTEKKIETLNNMGSYTSSHKNSSCKPRSTYEVNGNTVSKDEFYGELNKLFGRIFD